MAKTDKIRRPRAQTPKGFRDYFGPAVTERKAMLDRIAKVYHLYGFEALETSGVETVEALGSFLPDVERPNAGVFAWQDGGTENGDWMALRYDLTAPLARVYAQHRNELPMPYRRYAMGPVWRNEKPGPGRYRQFYQCDADTVGSASVAADAEICAMLADTLEAVGIARGDYVIRVNNRKVLNGVLEVAELAGDDKEAERGIVLRAIDKLDRLGVEGVRALLGEGRRDESGDFTEGAGLSADSCEVILDFVNAESGIAAKIDAGFAEDASAASDAGSDHGDLLHRARDWYRWLTNPPRDDEGKAIPFDGDIENCVALIWNRQVIRHLRGLVQGSSVGEDGVFELEQMLDLLQSSDKRSRIVIDPSVVRGLGYYTGPVYEAELNFPIPDEKGRPQRFGSVAGGGRYDDLVTRFTGQAVPATGVSIGVDRLLAALAAREAAAPAPAGPVVVTVMDRDRMADYQSIVAMLRKADIRAEVYLGNPKNFGNQLKYADRRGAPAAIIQGADEAARGVVQVKDLVLGARLSKEASLEEWKENPSQEEVPLDGLVAHLLKLLA